MKLKITAWAIQRPDKVIITSMIRAHRLEVINIYRDHMIGYQLGDAWRTAYRRGFRAVRVAVTALSTTCSSHEAQNQN